MPTDIEEWRPLRGRGDNSASSLGRVRRNEFIDKRGWHRAAQILTPHFREHRKDRSKDKVGVVRIVGGRTPAWVQVPRLVAEAFLPDYDPAFHEVQFRDGNPGNWCADNLKAVPRFVVKLDNRLAEVG